MPRHQVRRHRWTEQEVAYLREHYPAGFTESIAAALDVTVTQVHVKASSEGIRKDPEFVRLHCQIQKGEIVPGSEKARFQKGHTPFNKGLRRPGWHAGRMRETQFKKGEVNGFAARNLKPIGTILADAEGYLRIKARDRTPEDHQGWDRNVWPLLHRRVWEQHHGPIPPKHCVAFKDGNRQNCAIENLELITMRENARRNHWKNRLPPELAQVIMLNGALKRRIRRLHGEEQNQRSA